MARGCTLGIAQLSPKLGDVAANLDLYEQTLREARGRGVDLLVFPELSLTGYFLKDMVPTVALAVDDPTFHRLCALSREMPFVAGAVEETREYRFYNAAMWFEGGELRHVHRKVYPPTYGLFDELRYLARGDRLCAFDCRLGRAAMLLCEDLWHPSTAYIAAMDGALSIVVPSSSPIQGVERGELPENALYWQRLNAMTAETYGLFVVYANRVGFEDGIGFWGGSEILAPSGEILARAAYYEPDMIVGEIDPAAARRKRISAPMVRDENVDLTINELTRIRGREIAGVVRDLRRRALADLAAGPPARGTTRKRRAAAGKGAAPSVKAGVAAKKTRRTARTARKTGATAPTKRGRKGAPRRGGRRAAPKAAARAKAARARRR